MKSPTRTTAEQPRRLRRPRRLLLAAALLAAATMLAPQGIGGPASAKPTQSAEPRPTIVLVHGDFADASSWNDVTERLQRQGYNVVAPPNLLRGLSTDAPYLASFLQTIPGPIVLVAHSYGGFIATNAAAGNPNVRALVYVDAAIPAEGETMTDLTHDSCVQLPALNLVPIPGGDLDLYLRFDPNGPYEGFTSCFANGVPQAEATLLWAGQRPASAAQFTEASGPPAWQTIPSWSVVGIFDNVFPVDLQLEMSTRAGAQITQVKAGHLSMITRPDVVTGVIQTAIDSTG